MKVDYGFEIDGSQLLVDGRPLVVYEFENLATVEEVAVGVTADAGSVTVTRREGDLVREQHSDWFTETPHLFKKGRLIVIAGDHAEVLHALEAILGPQFAGG
jgi:hypothetical protein